ncbi:UNVERIFIED_CONTAM: hypothetical protein K2H54_029526 [Gekko kuhli]
MTKIYGGRQRNGVMPSHFSRGSKSVARRVLQALEGLKMVEKDQDGGRKLTPQGQRDLDRIAGQLGMKLYYKMKVVLCGVGFRRGWQDGVVVAILGLVKHKDGRSSQHFKNGNSSSVDALT